MNEVSQRGQGARPTVARHGSSTAPAVPGYELADVLGAGASSVVYAGVRLRDGLAVAVKVLAAASAEALGEREWSALAQSRHEHLLRVHEVVALDDGGRAVVLDLCEGGSLRAVLASRGHLTPGEVVTVLTPVAEVLARLHAGGLVHGDVAPGNVLLDRSGKPFLADLGTARLLGERAFAVHGTEGFVAPEVLDGLPPSPSSDVYAVGALAWFALAGSLPGPGVLRPPLAQAVPPGTVGHPMLDVVLRAVHHDPSARPDADALALALYECATPEPLSFVDSGTGELALLTQRLRGAAAAAPPDPAPAHPAWRQRVPASTRRLVRLVAAPALLALAVLGGVLVGQVLGRGGDPAHAAVPPTSTSTNPTLARNAPSQDPLGLVQALADARAEVWRSGLLARIGDVDAPGSAAWQGDAATVGELQRTGRHYEGLRLLAREAVALTVTPERSTVRARVDASAYVVVGPGGRSTQAARPGEPVILDLRWTKHGWRVAAVREATQGTR